ncbi:hypothetical protein OEZ86_012502 [Tetradesmus obliquus]|nr:hypothetical protein OEZ86_012502 [Tetradesmus obliquus]
MAVSCEPHAATLILNQLKQEVAEVKVACKLASQPNSSSAQSLQSLEREAQLARKQYDGLLEQRRKQAAELERIFAEWQQLEAGTAAQVQDSPAQRRAQQLQAQLADASAHLAEALYTQQQYTDVVQQLKQGHADFERQLEQLRSQLAGQQQLIAKTKAHLLQRLFRVTGTSDPQGLLLHVKAHLKAAASLQEAAAAACIKLETGAAG